VVIIAKLYCIINHTLYQLPGPLLDIDIPAKLYTEVDVNTDFYNCITLLEACTIKYKTRRVNKTLKVPFFCPFSFPLIHA